MIEIIKAVVYQDSESKKIFIQYNLDGIPKVAKLFTWVEYLNLNVETDLKNAIRVYLNPN
jgi:hypothetical protein